MKGDVNGDGKVDVADIVAILKIMKDAGVTQYTVTYHSNGGNSTPASQTVNAGETVTLAGAISRNADSSYTYSFKNWNTNSSDTGISYNAGQTIPINNNIDLYAQWNKTPITPTTTYKWYVGTTQPTAVDNPSTWRTSTSDAGFTSTPNISTLDKIWVAYPSNWTLEITDVDGYGVGNDYLSSSIKNSINGYIINRFTADSNTAAWVFKFTK